MSSDISSLVPNRGYDVRVGVNYRIGRKIGAGAFGDIYAGVNTTNDMPVAIKLVHSFLYDAFYV